MMLGLKIKLNDLRKLPVFWLGGETCAKRIRKWLLRCFLLPILCVSSSCSKVEKFSSDSPIEQQPNVPIVPPVPVTGSYLTTILFDKDGMPMAETEVSSQGLFPDSITSSAGHFDIPTRAITNPILDISIKMDEKLLELRINIPQDVFDAIVAVNKGQIQNTNLNRILGIRLIDETLSTARDPLSGRYVTVTLSLPRQSFDPVSKDLYSLNFEVLSHNNHDAVSDEFEISGRCTAGLRIRFTGEIVQATEQDCTSNGVTGVFSQRMSLSGTNQFSSITIEQTNPQTQSSVSQLLILKKFFCPAGFVKVPASNTTGLGARGASEC